MEFLCVSNRNSVNNQAIGRAIIHRLIDLQNWWHEIILIAFRFKLTGNMKWNSTNYEPFYIRNRIFDAKLRSIFDAQQISSPQWIQFSSAMSMHLDNSSNCPWRKIADEQQWCTFQLIFMRQWVIINYFFVDWLLFLCTLHKNNSFVAMLIQQQKWHETRSTECFCNSQHLL